MSEIESVLLKVAEIPVIVDQEQFAIEIQKYYSGHNEHSKKLEWTSDRIKSVIKLLDEYNSAKSRGTRPTNTQYHHANKYDVMDDGNQKVLIMKRKEISDPVLQIIPTEEYYQRILDAHIATGHGRRDKIVHALRDKYVVPIFAINIFINLCKMCLSKKSFLKRGIVEEPLISDDFKKRGQIDFVGFQTYPHEEYKWLVRNQESDTRGTLPNNSPESARVSHAQLDTLVNFMETHPNLARGYGKTIAAKKRSNEHWIRISNLLNSIAGGATKDCKAWAKYWTDYKNRIKRKNRNADPIKKPSIAHDSDPESDLDELENRVLDICNSDLGQALKYCSVETFPEPEGTADTCSNECKEPKEELRTSSFNDQHMDSVYNEPETAAGEDLQRLRLEHMRERHEVLMQGLRQTQEMERELHQLKKKKLEVEIAMLQNGLQPR